MKLQKADIRSGDEMYRYMFYHNPQPMWIYDLEDLSFLEVNDAAIHHYGYTRNEFLKMTLKDIRPSEDIEALLKDVEKTRRIYNPAGEWRHLTKEGKLINVEIISHTITFNGHKARHVMITDITERKLTQQKLTKVAHLYALLSHISQSIVRIRESEELFQTICRVAIESGQFRMAWIGLIDESDGMIKPVTHAGHEDGYLDNLQIATNGGQSGEGPTGSAFRSGNVVSILDISGDVKMGPWKNKALKRGYRSSAAVPFKRNGKTYGVFTFYASEPGFFSEDEQQMLQDIGENISYALDAMESETARKQMVNALRESEERLRSLNEELELRVFERTSQLESVNKELEAFSYSVSHDLRSPLRHINGFSEILVKQYSEQLPVEAQKHVKTIIGAAQKMGNLIDDLLSFSRTGRAELKKSSLNMSQVVNNALAQINLPGNSRKIEWYISLLPEVNCDSNLLQMAWVNLLENAIKYTRFREIAEISIGYKVEKEETVFYIKDNGVGFDMKYAQKLFGVFQRLHSSSQFEGTGIGLANVKRIISRHGGRIWAEAEPDKGATFYFTIPVASVVRQ